MFRPIYPHRWFLYAVAFIIAIFLILIWQISLYNIEQDFTFRDNEISYTIHLLKKQRAQSSTPLTAGNNYDISKWKTYRNEKYGFEMKYPPIGVVHKGKEFYNSPTFDFVTNNHGLILPFLTLFIERNDEKFHSIKDWFVEKIDRNEILTRTNSYTIKKLNGGGEFLEIDSLPPEWNEPIGPLYYLMSPDKKLILFISLHQDDDLYFYGYTGEMRNSLPKRALQTLIFF